MHRDGGRVQKLPSAGLVYMAEVWLRLADNYEARPQQIERLQIFGRTRHAPLQKSCRSSVKSSRPATGRKN